MIFLVWLTVVSQVMILHYKLFKTGTWLSHLPSVSACESDSQHRVGIFRFCRRPWDNPAAQLLTALGACILDPRGSGVEFLYLLFGRYGHDILGWPQALTVALHCTLVLAFCRAWRMLYFCFQRYPWLLAPAFDPEADEDERQAARARFIAQPKGSKVLDPGLGRKLRDLVETEADLKAPNLFAFFQALFTRLVVTSTFVERVFKDLTSWSNKNGQKLPSVGAKHVNAHFDAHVKRWRADLNEKPVESESGTFVPSSKTIYINIKLNCYNT